MKTPMTPAELEAFAARRVERLKAERAKCRNHLADMLRAMSSEALRLAETVEKGCETPLSLGFVASSWGFAESDVEADMRLRAALSEAENMLDAIRFAR